MDYQQFLKIITEQTPEFYDQTIQWGIIAGWIFITIGVAVMVAGVLAIWGFLKNDPDDAVMMASILGGGIVLIGLVGAGIGIVQVMECLICPKAYFIAQFAGYH